MYDVAVSQALELPKHARLNFLREYCQHYILRLMANHGDFSTMAFVGGTALRVLYQLPRFSEDLDFSATSNKKNEVVDMGKVSENLCIGLEKAGYKAIRAKMKLDRVVQSFFIKLPGLLHAVELSHDRRQQLAIKLEVDTNPPIGGNTEKSLVNKFFPIAIRHYDLPTLMAGKTHAALARSYPKGRDWYDIIWYLTRETPITPNFEFLTNALKQNGKEHLPINKGNYRSKLAQRFEELNWSQLLDDLQPFIENPQDLQMFDEEIVLKMIRSS